MTSSYGPFVSTDGPFFLTGGKYEEKLCSKGKAGLSKTQIQISDFYSGFSLFNIIFL